MIQIPSRPNLIVNYNTNPIPRQRSSWWLRRQSPFQCNFNLFSIARSTLVDKRSKYWLKDWKYRLKDQNCKFISKKSIWFDFFDINRSFLISFRLKSIKFDHFDIIWTCFNQFFRKDLDSVDQFGSKESIKRQFDPDTSWFGNLD